MPLQTGTNIIVAAKVEATYNTAPGASGATQMRIVDSPGLGLKMDTIKSAERRSDLLDTMARMGSRSAPGSFSSEMIVGAHDMWYEATLRTTWVPAVTITVDGGAALTSFTVNSTSQFTFAGTTTPIAAGLRVGDVVRFTNMSTAANNSINVRVKSIAGSVVNTFGTPLTVQSADSAATLTILKKIKDGGTPVRRTFYVDEYNADIDQSTVFGGVRYIGMKITGAPDGMAKVEFTALGANMTPLATTASPYYTSPTLPTGSPLVFADATISLGGTDLVSLTAFELNYVIAADTLKVIGSSGISPDIFDNKATLSGSMSSPRADLTRLTAYTAETEYELHILLVEPESEPKDCISIYVPRVKLTGVDASLGGDSAMIESLPWTAGAKDGAAATGYDPSMITMCTSAA